MGSKDTVLSDYLILGYWDFSVDQQKHLFLSAGKAVAKRQDEVTWSIAEKEGMRKVVDWIKGGDITRPIVWGWNMKPGHRVISISLEAFLTKLKEWEIE